MRKYAKLTLCGMAAVMLVAGCSKKDGAQTPSQTETATENPSAEESQEAVDNSKITKLGKYKGVEVTKISTEVTDEELDARIEGILKDNPEYTEVTGRAARLGDTVNIDFVGMKDGEAFEGGTGEDFDLELGSGSFIDGFEDGLVGAKTGAELSLNLMFPEDYHNKDMAGQEVVFDVTVNRIEEKKEAVLDANFVQRMSDFTTVDEFKADTLAAMESEKEAQADRQIENDVFLAVMEDTEFELDQDALESQYAGQLDYYTNMVQGYYGMTLKDYVAALGMTEDGFKDELRNVAESTMKQDLIVEAIAEAEGFKVEDADKENAAQELYHSDAKSLEETYGADFLERPALAMKVLAFIKENAVIK